MGNDPNALLRKVRLRLLWSSRPQDKFYGSLCMKLRDQLSSAVDTAATDGRVILWNPAFLVKEERHLAGIEAHEIWHCALCHHTRRGARDPHLWNIAGDLCINHALIQDGFTLPEGALFPGVKPFEDIPPGLTIEETYRRLKQHEQNQEKQGKGKGNGAPKPAGEVRDAGSLSQGQDGKGKGQGVALDPAKQEADWRRAVQVAAKAVKDSMGKLPAGVALLIGDVLDVKIPWEEQLIAQMTCKARETSDWSRPDRRMIPYGLFRPSKSGLRLGHVVMHWDTSGSCLDELKRWAGALVSLFRQYNPQRLTLIWGDADIDRDGIVEFDQQNPFTEESIRSLKTTGGGGTSHIPLFKHIEEQRWEPNVLVCLTDLWTQFPVVHPSYDVLWVTTSKGTAPFGSVIEIR